MNEKIGYPQFVDKRNIDILLNEENDLRYYIKIPINYNEAVPIKKVLVILKNPSKAKVNHEEFLYESDKTLNRVISYFYKNHYTEVVIVNLFARYFTESDRLNDYITEEDKIVGELNDVYINDFILSNIFERIVVGWGGYPKNSKKEMKNLYKKE
ncbi:DUF1643 domain-containing protein [Brucepastera parasyntrophica]|uniref:DUF1643 domain-containing protein n=1 Tax=Brucepastera parasyntrophica TaxID=2880008 RepID=UPI002109BAD4|nr:DUF1643 domain-containing protein [Brucepastera parasyntrophica]ULQ61057.1 DUF1643 domain-containing protein [Brucepastera parasyntrophica]